MGLHPRGRALGIGASSLSPGVVRMTGLAAARASFAETGSLLDDLASPRPILRIHGRYPTRSAAVLPFAQR